MQTIRVVVDIDVEDGNAKELAQAIFDERDAVGDFAVDVIARSNDDVDTSKLKAKTVAGATHVHKLEDGWCQMCDKYARRQHLIEVD